jgi:hypothetical protein
LEEGREGGIEMKNEELIMRGNGGVLTDGG